MLSSLRTHAFAGSTPSVTRLLKPHRHLTERTEIDGAKITRLNRQRRMACACGNDPTCLQRYTKLPQFIGKPGQRYQRIAQYIFAVTDELLAAHRDDRALFDEIARAPVRGCRWTKHEQMRASVVGNDLRGAGAKSSNRESRISMAGCSVSTASRTCCAV